MLKNKARVHLERDKVLKPLLRKVVLKPLHSKNEVYKALLESIVSQQLSVKAADTIYSRFKKLFRGRIPSPQTLASTPLNSLRNVGVSWQKASYLKNVAEYFISEKLPHVNWNKFSDEEVMYKLLPIKGVGRWTVEMVLIFTLAREDVFPIDDLAIQIKMAELYKLKRTQKTFKKQLLKIAQGWAPYRSVATRYIWGLKDISKVLPKP